MDAQKMENHRLAMEQLRTYMTTKKYWEGMNVSDKKRVCVQSKHHKIKDGVLMSVSITGKEREVITSLERVADIIEKYHTSQVAGGHSGIEATVEKITRLYCWGSVKNDEKYYMEEADKDTGVVLIPSGEEESEDDEESLLDTISADNDDSEMEEKEAVPQLFPKKLLLAAACNQERVNYCSEKNELTNIVFSAGHGKPGPSQKETEEGL